MFYFFTRRGQGILFALFFLLSFFISNVALAATSGPNNPSTGANDVSVGTVAWSNTGNIFTSNNVYATVSLPTSGNISNYLKATGFGFAIPAGATIDGITISVERKSGNANKFRDSAIRIIKGGVISSTNRASATSYPTSDTVAIYGGPADLWGETWTPSDINNSNFGVAFSSTRYASGGNSVVSVDHITITVTYTVANPVPTTTSISPSSKAYGENQFIMTVNGTNFVPSSVVNFNGSARTTTYVSANQLTVIIPASDLLTVGTANITVFNPAPGGGTSNAQTFTITKANQVITFGPLADKTFGSPDFTIFASSTSGLSVTFTSQTPAVCTVSANTVSLVSVGTCTIRAAQGGNDNYNPATPVDQSFLVVQSAVKFVITEATDGTVDLASLVVIQAQDISGSVVNTYQQDVTLVTSGSATGGGLVNIINGVGTTTISNDVIETVNLSLQDTESTGLDVSSTASVYFGPGETAALSITAASSTELVAGTRLPLVVSRQDRLGNNVLLGSETFYLYSNFSGPDKKFYDAENDGNIVTSILIPNNSSSATIWYYDELVGTPEVVVSDNISAPDDSIGVDDSSVSLSVTSAPATALLLSDPGDLVAGERLAYEVSRQDQFGNASDNGSLTVYLYETSPSSATVFYDASSGGNTITSLVLSSGVATSSFWLYGEQAGSFSVTVSDKSGSPDGSAGINDASDNITITANVTSRLSLNDPGDVTVGNRLGYAVSRFDAYNNAVVFGDLTVYLFHNDSVGTSTEFYDAASDGNTIDSLSILDGSSFEDFWLFASGVGSYNVTVSDADPADGATGITDDVDSVNVLAVPIVATRFVILETTDTVAGDTASIVVQAQDGSGNIDTSYNGSVTLNTSGNATPGGTVSIINGVGTINIIDTKAETVNLTLEDSAGSGLDVSFSRSITFLPGPTAQFLITGNTTVTAGDRINYTISRQDQYANIVSSGSDAVYLYSTAPVGTASFYNEATEGTQILSTTILDGLISTNVWLAVTKAGEWTTVASDNVSAPDGGDGLVDATSTLNVSPAETARLSLNDPGDMFNGTRLGYTATRYDAYDNVVTTGPATYYLYSNSGATSTAFYSTATGDSPITNISFSPNSSTVNFWYFEATNGIWTVYLSDNSSDPDGSSGIVDGEDGVIVSAVPIVAAKFIITASSNGGLINTPITINIRAVDEDNDIDTTYQQDVTLEVSGSGTGGGLINIVNGVGQAIVTSAIEGSITLTLEDTEATGLDVSYSYVLVFSQTAVVPSGGGSSAGTISPTVSFSGLAFPRANIEIVAIQKGLVPVGSASQGSNFGNFNAKYTGKLPASVRDFAIVVYDRDQRIVQTKIFKLGVNDTLFQNVLMAPTIELSQDNVTLGAFLGISGEAMPGYKIELMIDGVKAPEMALSNGKYNIVFNTYRLGLGEHQLKVRQVNSQGRASDYSIEKRFVLTKSFTPRADLNKDGKADIADWGIFTSRYRLVDDPNRLDLDLNSDGQVNFQDLSLLLQAIRN